jgi:hypothetical protein
MLLVNARRWVLADNTFWHARWDSSTSTMSTSTVGMSKGDPVTYEELTPEHKQKFDEIKALFEADLIGSFERTRHHGIRWKGFLPEGSCPKVLSMEWIYLSHRKSAPDHCAKKSTTW